MDDLELAKSRLREAGLSLVIAKSGTVIFESGDLGVKGLVRAIDEFGEELSDASVADTVVGKAAALLCVHAGISRVFAGMMSKKAVPVLDAAGIIHEHEWLVEQILNRTKGAPCPFEILVADCDTGSGAYELVTARIRELAAK